MIAAHSLSSFLTSQEQATSTQVEKISYNKAAVQLSQKPHNTSVGAENPGKERGVNRSWQPKPYQA